MNIDWLHLQKLTVVIIKENIDWLHLQFMQLQNNKN